MPPFLPGYNPGTWVEIVSAPYPSFDSLIANL